ncbi:hypothetical protein A7A09_020285, partial [Paracoccus methylarcula]
MTGVPVITLPDPAEVTVTAPGNGLPDEVEGNQEASEVTEPISDTVTDAAGSITDLLTGDDGVLDGIGDVVGGTVEAVTDLAGDLLGEDGVVVELVDSVVGKTLESVTGLAGDLLGEGGVVVELVDSVGETL